MVRSLVVGAMVTLLSPIALADWEPVADLGKVRFLWDSKEVRKSGNSTSFWVLTEFQDMQKNTVNGGMYRSSKTQYEVDCKANQLRGLYQSQHPKPLAQGDAIFLVKSPAPWEPVPEGSVFSLLAKKVCPAAK